MSFIRRGNIKVPHKASATIILTRIDGSPIKMLLDKIQCWEEHELRTGWVLTTVYWDIASSTAVRETFDAIDQEINGKAVVS